MNSYLSGDSTDMSLLKKKIPEYTSIIEKTVNDMSKNRATYDELVKSASTASMLIQIIDDWNMKLKAAQLGFNIAKTLMKKYPDKPAGYHYSGLFLSMVGIYKGPQYFLNYIVTIKNWVLHAIKIDPAFNHGAPYILLCGLYFEIPGFPVSIGDIYIAKKYCETALKKFPHNCTTYPFLAAIYDTLGEKSNASYYLNAGEKMCKPVNSSLEEKVWTEKDL